MHIHSFTVGPFSENTYLLTEGGKALVVDPGFFEEHEFEALRDKMKQEEVDPIGVLLTHAHVDHVLGLHRLLDHKDLPVYLSDRDRYLWNRFEPQARMFGFNVKGFDFEPEVLPAGGPWEVGPFRFEVLYTPGHAPDHVSLYREEEGVVIAGDALFRQGIGRTDLYKGDFKLLERSIREKLYTLPEDTEVYPGHGPKTTIGYEKKNNPFVSD